ncbi:MAG: hypothetical protein ABSC23_13715 [Bryobacteraceae bacterium]
MPRRKMLPPLPEIPGESTQDRFKRIGRALLSVRKSEIMPEKALAQLEGQKRRIDAKLAEVRREMAKRKTGQD